MYRSISLRIVHSWRKIISLAMVSFLKNSHALCINWCSQPGDTMDLALIGASWEKERARELGGQNIHSNIVIFLLTPTNTPVPKGVYTTFYLGALQENNDSVRISNHYFATVFKIHSSSSQFLTSKYFSPARTYPHVGFSRNSFSWWRVLTP